MLLRLPLGLLLAQAANAVHVYLTPQPAHALSSSLSPEDASAALSSHLGLEQFEPYSVSLAHGAHGSQLFVGLGQKDSLVLTLESSNVEAILPESFTPTFTLEAPQSSPIFSLSSVISTYLHRASHSFASIFQSRHIRSFADVQSLATFFESSEEPAFAAVDLSNLNPSDSEYAAIAKGMRNMLERLSQDDRFTIAVLTFQPPSSVVRKRSLTQQSQAPFPSTAPPQQPIGSVSTCFTSLDVCNNSTSTCSGRGQCVEASKAGRTCFVCSCGVTQTGEGNSVKTEYWAGESCERKDISGPFVLFTGTVLVIILLIVGAVSLLYTVGEQTLPSTLLATAVVARKD